jgi:hypothetical protein
MVVRPTQLELSPILMRPNCEALAVYCGKHYRTTPVVLFGEPAFSAIVNAPKRSRGKVIASKFLMGGGITTALLIAALPIGTTASVISGLLAIGALCAFGLGIKLHHQKYEPSEQQLRDLAENDEQIQNLECLFQWRALLAEGHFEMIEVIPISSRKFPNGRPVDRRILKDDHGLIPLVKEEGFDGIRTRGRIPFGRIKIGSGHSRASTHLTSADLVNEPDSTLFEARMLWLTEAAKPFGARADNFMHCLEIIRQLRKYKLEQKQRKLHDIAMQINQDGVTSAQLSLVKKLNSGSSDSPFARFLPNIDLTGLPR